MHCYLLDYVLAEEGDGLGFAYILVIAETETAIRTLAARVKLALLADNE